MSHPNQFPSSVDPVRDLLWQIAQVGGVLALGALIVGLVARPTISLDLLWNLAIPLVPASLLVSPQIWPNVCPLATLNMMTNRKEGRVVNGILPVAGLVSIVLLLVLVPARRVLFNTDGVALAATILAVGLAALVLGAIYDAKAGFCNAICPVLPVERLYGQQPFVRLHNPRCTPCSMCTQRACIDLNPSKSLARTLSMAGQSKTWLTTGYGAFVAAFPGFVVGYYTTTDGPLSSAGAVYLHVALWCFVSYGVIATVATLGRVPNHMATRLAAGVAAALYYWFAAPLIVETWYLDPLVTVAIRIAALALVAVWTWRAGRACLHSRQTT